MSHAENLKEELNLEIVSIQKALVVLKHSYDCCKPIGLKENYSIEELDHWEAFTSRFSRTSDMATQKIINSIMIFEKSQTGSMKDKAAFCFKNAFVNSEDDFLNLRLTRNFIAHEYAKQDTNEVFKEVWHYYPILINFAEATIRYCHSNIL